MDVIHINKAALANILEEIYLKRGKVGSKAYAARLADAIFGAAALQQFHASDRAAKDLLGLDPL